MTYLAALQGGSPGPKRRWEDDVARGRRIPLSPLPPGVEESTKGFLASYKQCREILPPAQSIADYLIMRDLKRVFDDAIEHKFAGRQRYATSDKVYYGTVETRVLNALITPVPDSDEYLIVLNRNLWESLQILSFMIVACLDLDRLPATFDRQRAKTFEPLFRQTIEAIVLQKELPFFFTDELTPLDERRRMFWSYLHEAMNTFVFGHEYAHFLHGHFDRDARIAAARIADTDVPHYQADWAQELESDNTGLDLTVFRFMDFVVGNGSSQEQEIDRHELMTIGIQGAVLFLNFLQHIESVLCTVYSPGSTHPPTMLRIAALMSTIGRQIGHPATLDFFLRRLNVLTNGLAVYFAQAPMVVPAADPTRQIEQRLQTAVFSEIFRRTHHDVLADLYRFHDNVGAPPGWLTTFDASQLPPARVSDMVERCIGVLEKNAAIWRVPVPPRRTARG